MDEDPKKSAVEELTDVQFKFEVKKVCRCVLVNFPFVKKMQCSIINTSYRCIVCVCARVCVGPAGANQAGSPGKHSFSPQCNRARS